MNATLSKRIALAADPQLQRSCYSPPTQLYLPQLPRYCYFPQAIAHTTLPILPVPQSANTPSKLLASYTRPHHEYRHGDEAGHEPAKSYTHPHHVRPIISMLHQANPRRRKRPVSSSHHVRLKTKRKKKKKESLPHHHPTYYQPNPPASPIQTIRTEQKAFQPCQRVQQDFASLRLAYPTQMPQPNQTRANQGQNQAQGAAQPPTPLTKARKDVRVAYRGSSFISQCFGPRTSGIMSQSRRANLTPRYSLFSACRRDGLFAAADDD